MPPVVAAAAIAGGAAITGGVLSSRANSNAAKTQDSAAKRAEQIAIDNENRRRQEYDQQQANLKAQWDAEQARLAPRRALGDSLLQQFASRTGNSLGSLARPPAASAPPPGWVPGQVSATSQPRTLASMAGYGDAPLDPALTPPQDMSLGNVFNWGTPRRV